jgi:peptidoglycan/LPS O-acetylase OafA/YrhL/lysophospholipase L1-like esterase
MPSEPAAKPRATIAHLPALDGLRGLAVVAVLLFHDDRLVGGYLGVDLFFVLSGYLITSLLLAEWRGAGRVDLAAFWVRRARRLFPALLALLAAVGLYARLVAKPAEVAGIRADGLATLAYVANWRAIFSGKSYWDLFVAPSPLEHTWSLAIEEQFYVVWPLVTVGVLRASRGSARALAAACVALAAASTAALAWLSSPEGGSRAYMGTDTRGAAILLGAALACAMAVRGTLATARAVRALDAAGALAAAGLAIAWATLEGQSPLLYRGGFLATEVLALVLIACAAHGDRSLVARALSAAPLAKIGLWSYGLYLWHWPLYCLLTRERVHASGLALTALRLGATFAVAIASFYLYEQPIRRRGVWFGRPALVVPGAALATVAALLVGTRARALPPPPPPVVEAKGSTRILVEGDSVAMALGERLAFVQRGTDADVVVRGVGDCSLLEGVVPVFSLSNTAHAGGNCAERWASDARELQPSVTFVVLGGGFFAKAKIDGKLQRACDAPWRAAFARELEARLDSIRATSGRVVVAIAPYPVGLWEKANPRSLVDCFDDTLAEVAKRLPGVALLDLRAELCPGGACAMESAGAPIRPDGVHFDGVGAEAIARWTLARLLEQAAPGAAPGAPATAPGAPAIAPGAPVR